VNYAPTEDQANVLGGLDQLIAATSPPAPTQPLRFCFDSTFNRAVAEAGYLDIASQEGYGLLEAALVVERLARCPWLVEAGTTALVRPLLDIDPGGEPIALVQGSYDQASRYLPFARWLVVDRGSDVQVIRVNSQNVEAVETLMAYPYGRLRSLEGSEHYAHTDAAAIRRRWRIALAAEAAGCMAAALALVVRHVSDRHAFGRPLGAFQAIQHRLAMAAETTEATKLLALRAAWSDDECDSAVAAGFAQSRTAELTYDLHQFCGAMGLTLEFPLHLWTYRLRALAGELGGASVQSRAAAHAAWDTIS
jgi:hypothetical protein